MEIHIEKFIGNVSEKHYGDNYLNIDFDKIIGELNTAKEICQDPETKEKLDEAIEAGQSCNERKLNKALKWLAENALDFIKSVSSDVLVALISSQL